MSSKFRLNLLTALAATGVGLAGFLSHHFYQVRSGAAGFQSFCNLGESMNCDAVAASSYAEFFGGIPLSSFGTGWYLAILVIALMARLPDWKKESAYALVGFSGLGLLMSAYYLFIMVFVLKTYCVLCLALDAVGIAIFALAWTLKRTESASREAADSSKWKSFAGIGAGSILVAVLALKGMDTPAMEGISTDEIVSSVLNRPVLPVKTGEELPSFGPKDAPITITEFADFQCPSCRLGALTMKSVLLRYPKQVRVVFKNFPLDGTCNRMMEGRRGHPVACEAARAAICAHKQGKFAPVYEDIFSNQEKLAEGKPAEYAKAAGVDMAEFQKCVSSEETQAAISRDIEEALAVGVASTPTFFINGRKVDGVYPINIWSKIIDALHR